MGHALRRIVHHRRVDTPVVGVLRTAPNPQSPLVSDKRSVLIDPSFVRPSNYFITHIKAPRAYGGIVDDTLYWPPLRQVRG